MCCDGRNNSMISYAMISRSGGRKCNEDSIEMCSMDGNYVFALADGLGGPGGGDEASACVTKEAIDVFRRKCDSCDYLTHAFENAQEWLLQKKAQNGTKEEMKSTMVVLHITEKQIRWAHIGDSRLYYFHKNHIVSRTLDHSVPQMLALGGQIKESEIRYHKDRNRVLRVMGTPWEGESYSVADPIETLDDQAFVLCSDGFWELITEKEMEKTLKQSSSVAQWLEKMEKIVAKRGENKDMDNYSAICVYIAGE